LLVLRGELENKSMLLDIDEGEIKAPFILSQSKVLAIRGSLKDTNITKIGEICIGDAKLLKSFINAFSSDEIVLSQKANKLSLSATKESLKVSAVLRDPQYIKETLPKGKTFDDTLKLVSENIFELTKEQANKIVKNTSVIGAKDLILEGKDDIITLKTDSNENLLSEDFKITTKINSFKIKVNSFLIDLLSIINDKVIISAKDNSAIYIKIDNESFCIEYVLASLKTD
jgi:hypothetical protein